MTKTVKLPPGVDGKQYGVTTMKTVGPFFVSLMEKQRTARLSDEELVAAMRAEFPGRKGNNYDRDIRLYRSMYNNGKWSVQNNLVPDFSVPKYINRRPVIAHTGPKSKREQE